MVLYYQVHFYVFDIDVGNLEFHWDYKLVNHAWTMFLNQEKILRLKLV